MEAGIQAQNALLHQQTTLLTAKVDEQSRDRGEKFEKHDKDIEAKFNALSGELKRSFTILNYNLHRKLEEQVPLNGVPIPQR
jgi:hypothetical protein